MDYTLSFVLKNNHRSGSAALSSPATMHSVFKRYMKNMVSIYTHLIELSYLMLIGP